MAYSLVKRGAAVRVIDDPNGHTASKRAAGVMNPITGRRFVKTWMADTILPLARKYYGEIETQSGQELLRDVEIRIPPGLLDPPAHGDPAKCAAVVAGNVETSQRIVDVLLGAIGIAAASQGTMNNVLIGDETFGYYETIGGGSGATADQDGADAVLTHMTNTRITDPEVLERRPSDSKGGPASKSRSESGAGRHSVVRALLGSPRGLDDSLSACGRLG